MPSLMPSYFSCFFSSIFHDFFFVFLSLSLFLFSCQVSYPWLESSSFSSLWGCRVICISPSWFSVLQEKALETLSQTVIIITHTASYFLEWNSSISFSKHRRDLGNERHVFLSILTLSHLLHHFDHIFSSLGWSSLSFFSSLMRYTFSLLIPCVFRIEEMQTLLLLLLLLLCWNLCPSFTLIRGWKT